MSFNTLVYEWLNLHMMVLETPHLIFRTWRKSDINVMADINQDKEVMRYFPSIQTPEQTKRFLDKVMAHQKEHGFSLYATELKSKGELIGFVGLFHVQFEAHFTPAVEIGWRLSSAHWNKGYATEAALTVLDYAFTQLNLSQIVSLTSKINVPSQRVMQKIGLRHDSDDDFDNPNIDKDSPLLPHVLYRMRRDDYFKKK
jgi:RimJ/RimL family protein N-acetyltransferase